MTFIIGIFQFNCKSERKQVKCNKKHSFVKWSGIKNQNSKSAAAMLTQLNWP